MNQWVGKPMMQWIHESMDHSEPMNEWMIEWLNEWMNDWLNEWMTEWMNKWTNEQMNKWANEQMNKWTNEWMNEWMNDWMNERTNELVSWWVNESMICWTFNFSRKMKRWSNDDEERINEPMNQYKVNEWIKESMNEWSNESTKQGSRITLEQSLMHHFGTQPFSTLFGTQNDTYHHNNANHTDMRVTVTDRRNILEAWRVPKREVGLGFRWPPCAHH